MEKSRFHFLGFPEFLAAAAERAGRPDLAGPAGRVEALAALSILCAQAVEAESEEAAAILKQAAEFRHQLQITFEAADTMLRAVAQACSVDPAALCESTRHESTGGKRPRRRKPSHEPKPHEAP